jgi:hypothetical protein
MIDKPIILFPEPDSPTIDSVSPFEMEKVILEAARI